MLELRATTYRDATRAPQLDAWIDMYGGDAFADAVKRYRGLVEKAAAGADDATRARMTYNFRRACDLEWMFWKAALDETRWPTYASAVPMVSMDSMGA